MIKLNTKLVTVALTTIYAVFTGVAAMAADTEIFFRDPPANAPKPNVLFIMSTAGTMNGAIDDPNGNTSSKIEVLQNILRDIARNETRINMGLMRYSNPGGPVVYPITDLSGSVDPGTEIAKLTDAIGSAPDVPGEPNDRRILRSDDGTGTGTVVITGESDANGLIFGREGEMVGIRFPAVDIPQGANLLSAQLRLTVYDSDHANVGEADQADDADFTILIEDSDNSAGLMPESDYLLTRTFVNGKDWNNVEPWTGAQADNHESVVSPDFKNELEDVFNRTGWCGGNAVSIFIVARNDSTGTRIAESFDSNSIYAPELFITWDETTIDTSSGEGCYQSSVVSTVASDADDAEDVRQNPSSLELSADISDLDFQTNDAGGALRGDSEAIGLLFKNVNIPQGSTIFRSSLTMTSKGSHSDPYSMSVAAINDPTISSLTGGFSTLAKSTSTIWSGNETWSDNEEINSSNISAAISGIVGSASWNNDGTANNIALVLTPTATNQRRVQSHESDPGTPVKLTTFFRGLYTPASSSVRNDLEVAVDDFKLVTGQPTAETYLEGYKYFTGKPVDFGTVRGFPTRTTNRVSHPLSYEFGEMDYASGGEASDCDNAGGYYGEVNACRSQQIVANGTNDADGNRLAPTYIKPSMAQCQTNHIIMLTDGSPTSFENSSAAKFSSITGVTCPTSDNGETCGVDLAAYMANNDINPDLPDDQFIKTHTIHFGSVNDNKIRFLQNVAEAGADENVNIAENGADLENIFEGVISSLAKVNTSFVSAGITVNQSNRLTHRDELYFSLFRPEGFAHWPGNVKRYKIFGSEIRDVTNTEAIEAGADVFKDEARSWWSPIDDGNDAGEGGAASQLDFTTSPRVTFSNITSDSNISPTTGNLVRITNLTPDWNTLLATPDGMTTSLDVLRWVMGYDVYGANPTAMHNLVGDPLHSKPTILTYRGADHSRTVDGVTTNERDMVFVGTNHGFLHAFYTEDGAEEWSFIPKELLSNVKDYVINDRQDPAAHEYGVDGSISIYIDDLNGDGAVDVDDGDKAYLYVGLRRGGSSYYAFDVTDHDNPIMMFKIDNSTTGFSELGQTWSRPIIAKLGNSAGSRTDASGKRYDLVMAFGGGYDVNQDPAAVVPKDGAPSVDTIGRTVFLANALTGAKIWDARSNATQYTQAGSITLMNSVPADIKAIDPRTPGYIEHIYAADTAGQIFRFDFDVEWDGSSADALSQGGMFASIQDAADGTACADSNCNRRFFYSPDVAIVPRPNGLSYVAVSIGTGYRAHPLSTQTDDYFFGFRDMGVLQRETATVTTTDAEGNTLNSVVQTGFSVFNNNDGSVDIDGAPDIFGASGSEVITLANLVDITTYPSGTTALDAVENFDNPKAGWYLALGSGEKVLAESITFNNRVIFTTYLPDGQSPTSCAPTQGTGRAFAVNIIDGTPVVDFNNDGYDQGDRYIDLFNIGIPPEPQVIVLGNGPELLIGRQLATELIDVDWGEMDRIKWRERKRR